VGDLIEDSERLLEDMIEQQRAKVVRRAREVMPGCSFEDVLNPDGHAALRADAAFNYEDGILAGLIAAQIALRTRVYLPARRGEPGVGPLPSIHD
jgi:hypothetical protein